MLVFNHHHINTEGKSVEQIVDIRFKEAEIRAAKEAEDRAELARKLAENKKDLVTPAKDEPKKVELATVPHPTGIGRLVSKVRQKLGL